jgi:WD40 repeat protein
MTRNDKMIELKNLYKKIKQMSSIKSENNRFLIVNYESDEHAMMNSTTVGSYGGTGGSYGGTAGTVDSTTNSTAGTMNTTNGINGSTGSSSTGKHLITINNDKLIIKKLDNAIANSATMNNNNNDNIINNNNNVIDGITSMHDSPATTDELVIDFNDVFITCFQFISCRFKNVKKSNCKIIVSLINGFVYCFDGDKIMNQFTNDTSIDTMDHISIDIDYNLLWKIKSGHEAIILCMATSEPRNQNIHYNSFQENQQKLFATGSADSIIKVWDLQKGYQTHNLKGHAGIISALAFGTIPSSSKDPWILASASDDCSIRIWDLKGKSCLSILQDHVSVVRELAFTDCGSFLVSGGRDKVFIKWYVAL